MNQGWIDKMNGWTNNKESSLAMKVWRSIYDDRKSDGAP